MAAAKQLLCLMYAAFVGFNIAEAVNFATLHWIPFGLKAKVGDFSSDRDGRAISRLRLYVHVGVQVYPRQRADRHGHLLAEGLLRTGG